MPIILGVRKKYLICQDFQERILEVKLPDTLNKTSLTFRVKLISPVDPVKINTDQCSFKKQEWNNISQGVVKDEFIIQFFV